MAHLETAATKSKVAFFSSKIEYKIIEILPQTCEFIKFRKNLKNLKRDLMIPKMHLQSQLFYCLYRFRLVLFINRTYENQTGEREQE